MAERVLVFQPIFTHGAGLDFRVLGVQFWIADRLGALGLEGASALMRDPEADEPRITATSAPDDDDIAKALASNGARYGLVTTFAVQDDRPRLAIGKLAELRAGQLHVLGSWTFDRAEPLPAATLRLLMQSAAKLGHALEPVAWELVFDTTDATIAGNYLTALGALSVIEQGFAFDEDSAETSLRALLSGVQVKMRPAIDLLPRLVDALHDHERAPIEMLRAAVEAAHDLLPLPPDSWTPMLRSVGRGGTLVN
ncbi:MAG TPA: hypothetical protein VG755_22860 [Nannocystaceae bacterium]|nr:hypothetical protein [Nannocystaceae bacterium]